MTKGLQETEIIETNPEKEKINGFFEQSVKEMKYLKDFSHHTIKGCWSVFNRWLRISGQMCEWSK